MQEHAPDCSISAPFDNISSSELNFAISLVNKHSRSLDILNRGNLVDHENKQIKNEIVLMVLQYLCDEGYHTARMMLQDEANVHNHEDNERQKELRRLRKAILDGDWREADKLISAKPLLKNHKSLCYAIYKQQFLECIEHHDGQKAFTLLNKRLKPLESEQATIHEFRDLCYLLSARSVHDAPSFSQWDGVGAGRERLADQIQEMFRIETIEKDAYVPPGRLFSLIKQAVAYQVDCSRYHPKVLPKIKTLLADYSACVIPNDILHTLNGHTQNVKCIEFVGETTTILASGSSDYTVRLWDIENNSKSVALLKGHKGRVWSLSATKNSEWLASASSDTTVRLWKLNYNNFNSISNGDDTSNNDIISVKCSKIFSAPTPGDLYTVNFHPAGRHLVFGGYDRVLNLFDIDTGQIVKSFIGHNLAITSAAFLPMGNLVATGSKDYSVRFWDLVSGVCVKTAIGLHVGEVTSVALNQNGSQLLSCSKDNSNRIWDMRMMRSRQTLKGHQNTSKNFVRASFAHSNLVVGGSEDGCGYIWDSESGDIVQRLAAHTGIVYDLRWHNESSMFASCSEDMTVRTWYYNESK